MLKVKTIRTGLLPEWGTLTLLFCPKFGIVPFRQGFLTEGLQRLSFVRLPMTGAQRAQAEKEEQKGPEPNTECFHTDWQSLCGQVYK